MSAARLLIEAGLSVRVAPGGGLAVDGLAGLPTCRVRELLDHAKTHKAEILAELSTISIVVEPWQCGACGGSTFWRGLAGQAVCRLCHPPAPGALEWLEAHGRTCA